MEFIFNSKDDFTIFHYMEHCFYVNLNELLHPDDVKNIENINDLIEFYTNRFEDRLIEIEPITSIYNFTISFNEMKRVIELKENKKGAVTGLDFNEGGSGTTIKKCCYLPLYEHAKFGKMIGAGEYSVFTCQYSSVFGYVYYGAVASNSELEAKSILSNCSLSL
ncbi:MAG: hypothetical protein DA328_04430 [Nitrososphaeraceae archaeon]|nr:hypothetical protein [Nitrososphaeraceae archaeon]